MKPFIWQMFRSARLRDTEITIQFALSFWHQFSIGKLFWLLPVCVSLQGLSTGLQQYPVTTLPPQTPVSVGDSWLTRISGLSGLALFHAFSGTQTQTGDMGPLQWVGSLSTWEL